MCTMLLYTHKPQLTTMGKSLIHNNSCWRQWLKESRCHSIPVMKDVHEGVHDDVTFSTEEGVWLTVPTADDSWVAPTLLADV